MRTRFPVLAAVAAAALLLSGCSGSPAPAGTSKAAAGIKVPASISSKGALDVGVYFNYPPYTYAEGGQLKGIEADLMRAVAGKLGVKANFHDLAFEAMIPSVINGRMDALIGPMADTAERQQQVGFIDTLNVKMQALVKKGNPTHFDIANPCGAKGGEVSASNNLLTSQALAKKCEDEGKPTISELSLPDAGNVFQAVQTGRTDFTLQDPALAKYMVKSNPQLEMQGDPIPSAGGDLEGWVVGKDNSALTTAIVAAIDQLIKDGTWGKIMDQGGLKGAALLGPLVNGKEPQK